MPRLLLLVALLLAGLAVPRAGASGAPSGPDVSMYQHGTGKPIDWAAVSRAGQSFTIIKATEGSDRVDPWFAREWAAAGAAGMVRGAYHYANPAGSADAQAAFVVRTVGSTREAGNLGIALDLESTGGLSPTKLVAWAHAFLNGVEKRTGRTPIVYSYPYFWQNAMAGDRSFGAYPLWLASYSSHPPSALPGWSQWTFWQHSSTSHLPGIPGNVDHNVLCCGPGTLTALADGRSREIAALWRRLGGASGQLGLPLGPETAVPDGWGQVFQKGYVATTSTHGTHAVLGAVWERYKTLGGATGPLGVPTGDQQVLLAAPGHADLSQQEFVGGRIVFSAATGAHEVQQPILARWIKDGALRALEGLPTKGRVNGSQQFSRGGLYLTPTGVHLVPGAIRDRYEQLGGSGSALGLPTAEPLELSPSMTLVTFELGQLVEVVAGGQRLVL